MVINPNDKEWFFTLVYLFPEEQCGLRKDTMIMATP
jgi:hypothetical protein